MQTCAVYLLLRGWKQSERTADNSATAPRADVRANSGADRWLAVSIILLGWIGGHALEDLLSAIPSSNDDFGLF